MEVSRESASGSSTGMRENRLPDYIEHILRPPLWAIKLRYLAHPQGSAESFCNDVLLSPKVGPSIALWNKLPIPAIKASGTGQSSGFLPAPS